LPIFPWSFTACAAATIPTDDGETMTSPSSVGIVAAAQAVKDQGKIGKVYVTGLGLPSDQIRI
jgi:hypothetical protein